MSRLGVQVAILDLAVGLSEKHQMAMKIEKKYYRKYAMDEVGPLCHHWHSCVPSWTMILVLLLAGWW